MADRTFSEEEVLRLARTAYENGEATFDVDAARCALLVIDMQDEFVKPEWCPYWVPEATRLVPRLQHVIAHCRRRGIPIIYTLFAKTLAPLDRPASGRFMPNRYSGPGLDDLRLFEESRLWHELAPAPGELVLHKPSYGAFYDTPLETVLKNLGRDTVIISGCLTNFCCGMTARQAYERGYRVIFGSDLTATDDPALQEPELKVLRKGFARVMTAEEIVAATA